MSWLKNFLFGTKPNSSESLYADFGIVSTGEAWHWKKTTGLNLDMLRGYPGELPKKLLETITSGEPDCICLIACNPWHIIVRHGTSVRHFSTSADTDDMKALTRLLNQAYKPRGHYTGCFVWDTLKAK